MAVALTFIITFTSCLSIFIFLLLREKNKSMPMKGRFQQLQQEFEQLRQEKNLNQQQYLQKIEALQNKVFDFETKNKLLEYQTKNLEQEKQEWSHNKEVILHKLSEEIIKKSHEQQVKISANQEHNIKKITTDLFKNFENVTAKVTSLNDQIQKSSKDIELTKSALLNPGSSGKSAEITLENILKNSGLKEKQNLQAQGDYILQSHFSGFDYKSDSAGKRPDAILFFSNDQIAVIDSKSSSHFLELEQARQDNDLEQEKIILGKIKESFRKHVESLKKKDYAKFLFQDLLNKKSSDVKIMIIMFLQTEKMLDIIHETDPDFSRRAMESGIIIATPIGLINLLSQARIVIDRIKQEKNIEILKIEVRKLLDKIAVIFKDSSEIGKSLNKALNYHDKMTKSLNRGVYSSIEKISELGIDSKKSTNINKIEELATKEGD